MSKLGVTLEAGESSSAAHDLPEAIVHGQFSAGWTCRFDPKSSQYILVPDFLSVGEKKKKHVGPHFDSRLSSPASAVSRTSAASTSKPYSQVCSKAHISSDMFATRIYQQFPNAEESYISQLMKQYRNRENLVISALLSEGYERTNVILDDSLFYKLKSAFPNVESELIRRLLIRNDNREHSTISAILGQFGLFNTARYEYSQCPQMKLKYLKFAYPDVDEIILLDLLFNNDHNVNKVIEHLHKFGYHSSELKVKISKLSETTLVKEAIDKLNASRPISLPLRLKNHPNLEEQENIRKQVCEKFQDIDITLINAALESSGFDIQITEHFLQSMTPQSSDKYLVRTLPDKSVPAERLLWSRAVQTNLPIEDITLMLTDCNIYTDTGERKDQCTWTKEDGIIVKQVTKLAKGPSLAKGPCPRPERPKITKIWHSCAKGPNPELRQGPQAKSQYKSQSKGPDKANRKGPIGKQIKTLKEQREQEEEW